MENLYVAGYPMAAFNRVAFDFGQGDGISITQNLGYNSQYKDLAAKMFGMAIDQLNVEYPAFATINISTSLDDARNLSVKVSGEGVEDFASVMGDDAVLNVCLVEDGIVSNQLNQGKWETQFTHNCVLRDYMTDVAGEAINWNGNVYENDYVLALPETWKAENMRVVAFISRPLKSANGFDKFVSNTEMADVTSVTDGIGSTVASTDKVGEVARYTADGVRLSAPQKGINIVRLSDGKTMKVVVK